MESEEPMPPPINYEDGCWEDSVPVLAIQYTPHNGDSWVPWIIITFNIFVPGTGTILAALIT